VIDSAIQECTDFVQLALANAPAERLIIFSDGLELQPFDQFEVAAVVRQDRKAVLERGRPDEQIEIAEELAFFSQPPSLFPEALTDLFVDPQYRHIFKKHLQSHLTLVRISGVVHAFIELSQKDDAQCESLQAAVPSAY
jgi:hypothetical protein